MRDRRSSALLGVLALAVLPGPGRAGSPPAGDFRVTPQAVTLDGNFARAQLLVAATNARAAADEHAEDLTHQARYLSSAPKVVTADAEGRLLAAGNGSATVRVTVGAVSRAVPVTVTGVVAAPPIGFREHVMPILTKAGCNAGACHASQYGKGGFKLSVFGS